jgi:CRP-like cAMP-binding protein
LRGALSQSELAAMVGCTRQSANRVIGQFTDDGFIRVDRESIVVIDLAGLERASRR